MKILAFDLSSRQGSIAYYEADAAAPCLAQHDWANDRRNSAPFFQALDELVRAHGTPEMILVGLGPGSYTGTRIAISAAVGLQMVCGAELCGLSSICALSDQEDYLVVGDAKRGSFFYVHISRSNVCGEILLLREAEVAERIAQTNVPVFSSDKLPQFTRLQLAFPSAEILCRSAKISKNPARAPLEPIYLRPPHITSPART